MKRDLMRFAHCGCCNAPVDTLAEGETERAWWLVQTLTFTCGNVTELRWYNGEVLGQDRITPCPHEKEHENHD